MKAYLYFINQYNQKLDFCSIEIGTSYNAHAKKNQVEINQSKNNTESNNLNNNSYVTIELNNLATKYGFTYNLINCIHKSKDSLYYYIRVNDNGKFIKKQSNEALIKEEIKMNSYIRKYRHTIRKAKFNSIISSVGNTKLDVFILIVGVFITIGTPLVSLIKQSNEEFNSTTFILLVISTIVFLLQTIKALMSVLKNVLQFSSNITNTKLVDGKSKTDINKGIMNNLTKTYKNFSFIDFTDDIFMYSDLENANLTKFGENITINKKMPKYKKSSDSQKAIANVIGEKLKDDKMIFNGKLLGIGSDLKFYENEEIVFKKVDYHSYVSTDEMIYKNLTIASDPSYFLDGTEFSINPKTLGLKDISRSSLTNLIGINLLVILKNKTDNKEYIIINQQSKYNDANGSKYVASASGSLEPRDLVKGNKKYSFWKTLQKGMYRELSEESYICKDINEELAFKLIGSARLLSKGGKPDFFGTLTLDVSDNEINNILNNYNAMQNKLNGTLDLTKHIENNFMSIYPLDLFLNNDKADDLFSPQLKYLKYLLKKSTSK